VKTAGCLVAAAAVVGTAGWLAAASRGYVFWSTCRYGTIGRADLDGLHVRDAFIANLGTPTAVAVGGGYIYWLEPGVQALRLTDGSIERANLDGTDVRKGFVRTASTIYPSSGAIVGHVLRNAVAVDIAHTPVLAPGGATATISVDFTTPGAYEYLSTAGGSTGDAFSGMKGVLNVT
jgi:hypothetical protein